MAYDTILERTAVVVVVDDTNLAADIKKATDLVKAAFKEQGAAAKAAGAAVEQGAKQGADGSKEMAAEIARLRKEVDAAKKQIDEFTASTRRQKSATTETDRSIQELALQVRNVRSAYINGRISLAEFRTTSEGLKTAISGLLDTTTLTTAQQLKLNIASATAERGLASVRGEASRLGLAWNTQIALSNQFQQQLRGLGPLGSAAAGGLGLIQNGLGALNRPLDLSGVSMDRFLKITARAPEVLALATAAVTTLAVVGMVRLANAAAKTADDLDKASQSAGFGVEAYQEITFALGQAGVGFDQARQGLNDFNARLGQAAEGSTGVAEAYRKLGVEVFDANGKIRDGEEVFVELFNNLSGIESAATQAALGGLVFGEEFSRRVIPALNLGADGFAALRQEARDLGLVISGSAILSLVQYKEELAVLTRQFDTAKVEISAAFIPVLRDVLIPLLQNTIVPVLQTVAERVGHLTEAFTDAGPAGQEFRAQMAANLGPLVAFGQTAVGVGASVFGAFQTIMAGAAQLGAYLGTLLAEFERDPGSVVRSLSPLNTGADEFAMGLLNRTGDGGRAGPAPLGGVAAASEAGKAAAQAYYDSALASFDLAGAAFRFDLQAVLRDVYRGVDDALARGGGSFAASPARAATAGSPAGGGAGGPDAVAIEQARISALVQANVAANRAVVGAGYADIAAATEGFTAAEIAAGRERRDAELDAIRAREVAHRAMTDSMREGLRLVAQAEAQAARLSPFGANALAARAVSNGGAAAITAATEGFTAAEIAEAKARLSRSPFDAAQLAARANAFGGAAAAAASFDGFTAEEIAASRARRAAELESLRAREVAQRIYTDSLRDSVRLVGVAADEAARAFERAVQAFDESPGSAGAAFRPAAERFLLAGARRAAAVQAFDESPGGPGLSRDVINAGFNRRPALDLVAANPLASIQAGATATTRAGIEAARLQQQAANTFSQAVVNSAFQFADGIVQSIRSGDIGAAFNGLFQGAAGIAGAGNFGALSFLGGSIPIAGLVSAGISLIGSIFSLFLPGGSDRGGESSAARAAGVGPRGAPSVELNVTQNNSLAVSGITELRGALADTVDQLSRVMQQNVLPRLTSLEGART